jgi:hypothetical protein
MIFPVRFVRYGAADVPCDVFSHLEIDAIQNLCISLIYDWVVAVIELERDGVNKMLFLVRGERVEKELGLIIVLLELGPANALLDALNFRGISRAELAIELVVNLTKKLTYDNHPPLGQRAGRLSFDWASN